MKAYPLKTILFAAALAVSAAAGAQPRQHPAGRQQGTQSIPQAKREDIDAMKIAYITKELSLTPEEAQQFWPVYNQYNDKIQELRKKRMDAYKDTKDNMDKLSDKEVEAVIDNDLVIRQKELDLRKEYEVKFKAILPIKKVAKLYAAEEQFKRVLLDKLKDKPGGPGGSPNP